MNSWTQGRSLPLRLFSSATSRDVSKQCFDVIYGWASVPIRYLKGWILRILGFSLCLTFNTQVPRKPFCILDTNWNENPLLVIRITASSITTICTAFYNTKGFYIINK